MLTKTVTLKGRPIEYLLERKPRLKRLNVRVKPDGTVHVSSPPQIDADRIEKFLVSNADFILGALDRYASQQQQRGSLRDGCTLYSLGTPYTVELRIKDVKRPSAAAQGQVLTLTAPDAESARAAAVNWLNKRLRQHLAASLDRYYPCVGELGVAKPPFSLKDMTSRWGSCSRKTHRLAFSTLMREYPAEAVDYVVVHELSHFIHPNHSEDFYAFVEKVMPDWKTRRDMFKAPRRNCV